jgi:FKBP-type peptidyl-prolyl cis-trans isomerase FklB
MNLFEKLAKLKNDKSAANLQAGQEFLSQNKQKEGVIELPSGLQYQVLKEGDGPKPLEFNKVTCHYHGTLIDGTIFDSSVQRGQPASFPLNMVIKGWTEGLQLMHTGSKYRFFIPPHLGYGDRQVGPTIGPNSTLIFDVELLGIN